MNLAFNAMEFACEVHKEQRRKYTNTPYTEHLAEVAGIVSACFIEPVIAQKAIAVAWLHDCIEDQGVSIKDLGERFSEDIARAVLALSDLETGNRSERKALSRIRLSKAPSWVQTIKVADLISNTKSIVQFDPKFAVTYLEEKRLLLEVLTKADKRLVKIANKTIKI
jgi:GTP diphosphokinase / guanosine-3',5'-bis(diphosphate) 3'-diphosphatase